MYLGRFRICAVAALTAGLAVLVGCGGGDGNGKAFTSIAGSDSAYCQAYRSWKVYELDAGGAFDQSRPAALRTWWNAYLVAEETMLREAPSEISEAVEVKVRHIRTVMTPLLEKYEFDLKRMQREGTEVEQAAFYGLPPAEVDKAQETQYAYENRTCGTQPSPPAAKVAFEAGPSSKGFCSAITAFNGELEKVASSKFDPEVLRRLVTGDRFTEVLDGLDAAAPAEITADVEADTEWFRSRWSDVLGEYDYDIRNIYLEATPEDLAVFNRTHPAVLEHASRTTAYEEQVCEVG
jgi:hypothetical protein